MPQMAPMNWLTLMIYTIIIITMINSLNSFNFMMHPNNTKITQQLKLSTWKW